MLKDRFYYEDPYRTAFKSNVIHEGEDGGRPFVVLENTVFYPTGGGQPNDTGKLNGIRVTDVEEVDGEIRHYVETPLEAFVVSGKIDWERRFDHMQQHAGQHILTAAFVETAGYQTVSFHLGQDIVSIDLDSDQVIEEQLRAAEERANEIILENRPIQTEWVTDEELDRSKLRKELAVNGEIRLVIIPDFDYNGCGGTHPRTTGEVGSIKILGTERNKKKTRVHFVCGDRVLRQLGKKNAILKEAVGLLSAPEEQAVDAIRKLLEANKLLEKQAAELKESLIGFEAGELLAGAAGNTVKAAFEDRSIAELQKLARAAAAQSEESVILLAARNGDKLQFVAARGSGVPLSMKKAADAALSEIGGKGGGNDAFVQGGGETSLSAEQVLGVMEAALQ
ncbi:alanyl-tRNA editing protein [Edaphobacillus lindanitolerans]|uniref:Alanyl-tRNA synthetase n=1 Tax=Edaphobacillus lindanitolerans TaxID=550447 RepID=A0A1U7PKJ3_9BACI|nr:DHHA1 domain-containing protein [Edaphobacillus lindanitolerans]SIT85310.1 alanyl-tRNA synthetase [Edaphobacillus lindanitolerans]